MYTNILRTVCYLFICISALLLLKASFLYDLELYMTSFVCLIFGVVVLITINILTLIYDKSNEGD
jgi:hypothetical protein